MRRRPARQAFAVVLAAAMAIAFGWLAVLVAQPRAAAQADTWRPVLKGLYGDRVAALALVGPSAQISRPLLMLPQDQGLFRSVDDARTWAPVAVDPQRAPAVVLAVTRARDDDTGQRFYAGMRNTPLLGVSEDGGRTWLTHPGPPGVSRFDRLAGSRSGRVYAADRSVGALWTSGDRGETWESQSLTAIGITGRVDELFASPDDPLVYLVVNGTLYRSNDNPGEWKAVLGPTTADAATVSLAAIGPRGRLFAVARRASDSAMVLFSSEDRGESWPFGGWPDNVPADVVPRGLTAGEIGDGQPAVWLAFEGGQVFQSDDMGAVWRRLRTLPAPATLVAFDPANGNVWVGSDGLGLFLAAPRWLQFGAVPAEALAVAAPTYNLDRLVFLNARIRPERRDGGELKPAVHALYQSIGGEAWDRIDNYEGMGTNLLASPDFKRDQRLFSGRTLSTDGGLTWQPLGAAPGGGAPYVTAIGPVTGTHPVLYALEEPYVDGAGGTGLLRSENGGRSWRQTDANVAGIAAVVISPAYVEERAVYFATDRGVIFRAVDGLSFEQVGRISALTPERVLYDLAISPRYRNDLTLFAAVEDTSGSERAAVHISIDGGKVWTRRADGLPGMARPRTLVLSPSFSSDRVLFIGGERRTTDGPMPTFFGTDTAGVGWYPEVTLPQGSYVRSFAWGGSLANGRLFAAAGTAGLWVRTLDGPPEGLPTATATRTTTPPTVTSSATATPTATSTPTATPTASATVDPEQTPATPGTSATATGMATTTPTIEMSPEASPTPTATPSPTPTASATPTATSTATATPTATSTATRTPSIQWNYLPMTMKKRTFPRR